MSTNRIYGGKYTGIITIVLAAVIALGALIFTAGWRIDLENLAKGEENTSRIEWFEGEPYTAYTVKNIKKLIEKQSGNKGQYQKILWLGNSQLHYINQYREGDHLAPFWLRRNWTASHQIEALGCSLPNVNFQEYLVLSRYAAMRLPLSLIIAELVFDDLREDGLRGDFSEILGPESIMEIRNSSPTADSIVKKFTASGEHSEGDGDVLAGTVQQPVERWLNDRLSRSWKLWADRPQIEGNFLIVLYNLRNWTFGIKPTTVRKMIQTRYVSNMEALRDMLDNLSHRGIPVLLYIAPIRQDKPIPYDGSEYARWKGEIDALAHDYGARLVNLETLVPRDTWGSYTGDDIDFMHFQGPGHRLVAEALYPHVKEMLTGREH